MPRAAIVRKGAAPPGASRAASRRGRGPGRASPSPQPGHSDGAAGHPEWQLLASLGVSAEPSQAARAIVDAAMRAVATADDGRLYLLRHPETDRLVEVCRREGAATPIDDPWQGAAILRQALEGREVVTLGGAGATGWPELPGSLVEPGRSLLLAPLHTSAMTLGLLALSAGRPDAFAPRDGERLQGVASEATLVLLHWARLLRAEEACRAAEAILEALEDGLVALDGAGRITRVNRQLQALGLVTDVALPLPLAVDDPACPTALRDLLTPSGGTVIGPYDVTLEPPHEPRRTLRVYPSPLGTFNLGQVRIVRDVSAEREAAETQALFISQVAHELRGPLQHILGFTGLIRDFSDLPSENYQRFFSHIKDETEHLASLVDDLVELSRIELGRFAMRVEVARLDALVAKVVESARPRSLLQGLALEMEAPPDPIWARIDPLRITQVISNLVENALKFVPPGGSITVAVRPDGDDHAMVSVADSGLGIPPEAIPRLFQRFYQVRTDASRSTPGMGLGLYTCREIIRAHGGEIWAESVYGSGATFHFRIDRVTP